MDLLFDLAGPVAVILVFAFAMAEGGLLVGLFLPGEAPLIIAGVLAYQGRVSLAAMLLAACLGAVLGDSIGYWLGRRYGRRLETTKLGQKIGQQRWDKSRTYVRERGGKAVFLGRFVSIFRTLAPPVAGSAHMPYGRFLVWNVPAALTFATGLVMTGYLAGSRWHLVEEYLGQASLVIGIIVVVLAVVVVATRWIAANYPRLHNRIERLLERPRIRTLRERYHKEIAFLARRFDPRARLGLSVTVGVLVVVSFGLVFGEIFDEVIEQDTGFVDGPALRFLTDHRSPEVTTIMRSVTFFGGSIVALFMMTAAIVVHYVKTRESRQPAFLAFCLVGALGLAPVIKLIVQRARPEISPVMDVGGYAFPSGHATTSMIVFGALAYVLTRRLSWRADVWIWAGAGIASFLIGFSRLYLGVHWPTDVVGGWALGLLWLALGGVVTEIAWTVGEPRRADVAKRDDQPSPTSTR
ncbi:MAG: phosphatase PAP2 family protein [Actinobacteria bacterium]|nr:phosphatase PAP2 family protein [Actinomycetota bacterium]